MSLAYLQVLTDGQKKLNSQRELFRKTAQRISVTPREKAENMLEYSKRIAVTIESLPPIYNDLYMLVVVTSILINDWRRQK